MINLYKELIYKKREYIMSKQLLRSATSVGANVREARNAESKNDFIHKLGIAQKECDETIYWLELLHETDFISKEDFIQQSNGVIEVLKIIKSSILTAKKNKGNNA
jgi:four helix bundle protein